MVLIKFAQKVPPLMWISKKLFNQRLMKEPWKLYNTRKILISYTLNVPATRHFDKDIITALVEVTFISW